MTNKLCTDALTDISHYSFYTLLAYKQSVQRNNTGIVLENTEQTVEMQQEFQNDSNAEQPVEMGLLMHSHTPKKTNRCGDVVEFENDGMINPNLCKIQISFVCFIVLM